MSDYISQEITEQILTKRILCDYDLKTQHKMKLKKQIILTELEILKIDGKLFINPCSYCSKVFTTPSGLDQHLYSSSENGTHPVYKSDEDWVDPKPHACTHCSAKFATQSALVNHEWSLASEKGHPVTPESLKNLEDPNGKFSCTYCPARFATHDNL